MFQGRMNGTGRKNIYIQILTGALLGVKHPNYLRDSSKTHFTIPSVLGIVVHGLKREWVTLRLNSTVQNVLVLSRSSKIQTQL